MANKQKKNETLLSQSKLTTAVNAAVNHLSKAEELLPIDDDLIERDRKAAVALVKFPTEALETASEILEKEKGRLLSFDSAQVSSSLAYDVAMTKVLRQAEALVQSIQRSVWKNRAPGIEQTLILYAWLKRASRSDGSLVKYVDALAPHVVLRRRGSSRSAKNTDGADAPAGATDNSAANKAAAETAASNTNGASAPTMTH
jgi:hypothetical protein